MKFKEDVFYIKLILLIIMTTLILVVIYGRLSLAVHLILLMSLIFILTGISSFYKYCHVKKWASVEGKIVDIQEKFVITKISVYLSVKDYYPEIKYVYTYRGNNCISDNVSINKRDVLFCEVDGLGKEIDESNRPWYRWKKGSAIKVYVSPVNRCQSIIFKDMSKSTLYYNLRLIVGGALLFLIWVYLVFFPEKFMSFMSFINVFFSKGS